MVKSLIQYMMLSYSTNSRHSLEAESDSSSLDQHLSPRISLTSLRSLSAAPSMKVMVKPNVLHLPVLPGPRILHAVMLEHHTLLAISSFLTSLTCITPQMIRMSMEIQSLEERSATRDLTASKVTSHNLKPQRRQLMKRAGYTLVISV